MVGLVQQAQGAPMMQEQMPPEMAAQQGGAMPPEQQDTAMEGQQGEPMPPEQAQQDQQPKSPTSVIAGMLNEIMRGENGKLIVDKLTDGQGDLEMEIAETAANIMRTIIDTVRQQGREIPPKQARQGLMMAIAELINVAMRGGMMKQEERKRMAERTLAMGTYALEAGAGGLQ